MAPTRSLVERHLTHAGLTWPLFAAAEEFTDVSAGPHCAVVRPGWPAVARCNESAALTRFSLLAAWQALDPHPAVDSILSMKGDRRAGR